MVIGGFKKRTKDPSSWPMPHQRVLCYNPKRNILNKRFMIMDGSSFRDYTEIEYWCPLEDLIPEELKDPSKHI